MCWIIPPIAGLIEPSIAPEFYIDTVGAVELIGSCVRVYYCTEQMPLEAKGVPQLVVAAKIVRPFSSIPGAIARLASCLTFKERSPDIQPGGQWPRLVK